MSEVVKKEELKPGYKTTEFWLAVAAAVVGLLLESGIINGTAFLSEGLGLLAAALASLGYSYSRGKAKEKLSDGLK